MYKSYVIAILTFGFFPNLFCQEKAGSFYWQVYPNYTFAKVSKNDAKINAKLGSLPFIGLGLGYQRKIGEKLMFDISLGLHGVSSRFQSKPINNFEATFVPMISGNVYLPTKPNQKGHFLFLSLGANVTYEVGSQSLFVITDTTNNRIATLTTERANIFNVHGCIGVGVYFKKPKRDLSLSLKYSQGFSKAYKAVIMVQENQDKSLAEIISNDSFLSLQCRFFFKKRQLKTS